MKQLTWVWSIVVVLGGCASSDDCSPGCRDDETCLDGTCWLSCNDSDRCAAGEYCGEGRCQPTACGDGARNGDETDIDCGGACAACGVGRECGGASDCASRVCMLRCAAPTCGDQVQNGDETGVDCGGACLPCSGCDDDERNGDETDIDCGGSECGPCVDRRMCIEADDCVSGVCEAVGSVSVCVSCADEQRNNGETGVDCGGLNCEPCPPGCDDNERNGNETDVDCGGSCGPCPNGATCIDDGDCDASNTCDDSRCNYCGDGTPRADLGEAHAEECDEGATEVGACAYGVESCEVCGPSCHHVAGLTSYCGDGELDTENSEACDDGNTAVEACPYGETSCDVCGESCQVVAGITAFCGDGAVNGGGEQCDGSEMTACSEGQDCLACQCEDPPVLQVVHYALKEVSFSWSTASYATSYHLYEDADGSGAQIEAEIAATISVTDYDHPIPVHLRDQAVYRLEACNDAACVSSAPVSLDSGLVGAIGYLKATNVGAGDDYGEAIALSADGSTLAIGAPEETSDARGIYHQGEWPGPDDSTGSVRFESGAVYVFVQSNSGWSQQAFIKAAAPGEEARLGLSVALSADGNTLAAADVDPYDNPETVHVFARNAERWSAQDSFQASNAGMADGFGRALALSADGNTLVVGARWEDSNGDPQDDTLPSAGAVYLFTRSGSSWSEQHYLKASTIHAGANFGWAVAINADATTLAIGAKGEPSGDPGNPSDNTAPESGAAYVFTFDSGWSQQAYIKAPTPNTADHFGYAVALSADDGNTLAIGARGVESSNPTLNEAGAVYVTDRTASTWSEPVRLGVSSPGSSDYLGTAVALSANGDILAVGARGEDGAASGVGGLHNDDATAAGAVYVFSRDVMGWTEKVYVKAPNPYAGYEFGYALSLSSDGDTLAVGAPGESSNATGIGGNQTDTSLNDAGAAYLY